MLRMNCYCDLRKSSFSISPAVINFGECNVGDFKTEIVTLVNTSDVTAQIIPYFESGTITLSAKHITLAPGHQFRISINYVVRVVDPSYSKTITFINLMNPINEITLEIKAKNMDAYHMLLHDIFYKLYTYSVGKQVILFSKLCLFMRPNVRIFSVRNVFSEPLDVRLTTDDMMQVSIFCLKNVSIESDGEQLLEIKFNNHGIENRMRKSPQILNVLETISDNELTGKLSSTESTLSDCDLATSSACLTALHECFYDVSKAISNVVSKLSCANEASTKEKYSIASTNEKDDEIKEKVVRHFEFNFNHFQKV